MVFEFYIQSVRIHICFLLFVLIESDTHPGPEDPVKKQLPKYAGPAIPTAGAFTNTPAFLLFPLTKILPAA